jgi:hypothetical protein
MMNQEGHPFDTAESVSLNQSGVRQADWYPVASGVSAWTRLSHADQDAQSPIDLQTAPVPTRLRFV